jgi:hypothetical protein
MSGIFSLVSKSSGSTCIEAFSYDKCILEPMLESLKKKYTGKGILVSFSIEANTKILELNAEADTTTLKQKTNFSNVSEPLYSVILVKNKKVDNYLLDLQSFSFKSATRFLGDKISSNPVFFNILYDEGTINA